MIFIVFELDGSLDGKTNVTVIAGQIIDNVDFGYQSLVVTSSIGQLVWYDVDGDGLQDSGENGIGGVRIILSQDGKGVVGNRTTDSDGYYK